MQLHDFHHMLFAYSGLFSDVVRHCLPKGHENRVLKPLERRLAETEHTDAMVLWEYGEMLKSIPWKLFPKQALLAPLTNPVSIHPDGRCLDTLSHLWPFYLASTLARNDFDIKPEAQRQGTIDGAIDVFAIAREGHPPHPDYSIIRDPTGHPILGIAFECKSLTSRSSMAKEVRHCAKQLEDRGGGVAAIDVSGIVSKSIPGSGDSEEWVSQVASLHSELFQRCFDTLQESNSCDHVAFMMVHCRVFSSPQVTIGNTESYCVRDYRRIYSSGHTHYRLRATNQPIDLASSNAYFSHLFRDCGDKRFVVPTRSRVTRTLSPNTTVRVLFPFGANAGSPAIVQTTAGNTSIDKPIVPSTT